MVNSNVPCYNIFLYKPLYENNYYFVVPANGCR